MKLKCLNGAPLAEHLDFSEASLIAPDKQVFTFFTLERRNSSLSQLATQAALPVKWRNIQARNAKLRSGLSQQYVPKGGVYNEPPIFTYSFLPNQDGSFDSVRQTPLWDDTAHSVTFAGDEPEESEYIDHSLFVHTEFASSQIADDTTRITKDDADNSISSSSFMTTSFGTDASSASQFTPRSTDATDTAVLQLPPKLAITPLKNIPNAAYLDKIYPQTLTPNFICVLTDKVQHDEVKVQQGKYTMLLYKITVADDTSSNFRVSFFFPANEKKMNRDQVILRRKLDELRVGDIILLRNVALDFFKNVVSGQSLNANVRRAKTTIEILASADGLSGYRHIMPVAVDEHFVQVKKWAKARVAPAYGGGNGARKRKGEGLQKSLLKKALRSAKKGMDEMPPDTMPSQ